MRRECHAVQRRCSATRRPRCSNWNRSAIGAFTAAAGLRSIRVIISALPAVFVSFGADECFDALSDIARLCLVVRLDNQTPMADQGSAPGNLDRVRVVEEGQ